MVHNGVLRPLNGAAAWGDPKYVLGYRDPGTKVLLAASIPRGRKTQQILNPEPSDMQGRIWLTQVQAKNE